jgi:ABC-type uncharacterized transport system permease subunit
MKSSIFWYMLCSPVKVNQAVLGTCFVLVSCLVYSLILKVEVICSSETSVDFQWSVQSCNPEDRTLHKHCCENFYLCTHSCAYSLTHSVTVMCACMFVHMCTYMLTHAYAIAIL